MFAGGKPPHPPAPTGETTEIDVWHMDSDTWHTKQLSVERKKVEALTLVQPLTAPLPHKHVRARNT